MVDERMVDDLASPQHCAAPLPSWGRVDWLICAGLFVVSLFVVALHVRSYPPLSPVDEFQHLDYVLKASRFDIPVRSERAGFEAMAEAACRGVDSPGFVVPECGLGAYDPEVFPERGINTAASQTPIFYLITGLVSRVMVSVGLVESMLTAARLLGGVWLGLASALMWRTMAELGIRRRSRGFPIVMFAVTPLVVFHHATVNADNVLYFCGAGILHLTVLFERERLKWWWLVTAFVVAIAVEPTSVLVIGLSVGYLSLGAVSQSRWKIEHLGVAVGGFAAVMVTKGVVIPKMMSAWLPPVPGAPSAPMQTVNRSTGLSLDMVLEQVPRVFSPIQNTFLSFPLQSSITIVVLQLTNWLLLGLASVLAFGSAQDRSLVRLSRLVLIAMLAAGPFYTLYYALASSTDYPAPGRFGLPLLPALAVCAAGAIQVRAGLLAAGLLASVGVFTTVYQLVFV